MITQTVTLKRDGLPCILLHSNVKKITLGIVTSLLMAGTVILSPIVSPANQVIALLSIIIIPFLISFLITKNIVDSLTIVWLNEIFFGVSGAWIKIGPLPGRGLLLLIVIFSYIAFSHKRIQKQDKISKRSLYIIFYGLIFPLFLFLYSVIVRGATIANALSDVMRFTTVLMYFPIRDLFRRNFDICFGWIIGATSILSLLFVAMAIAPQNIRSLLIVNWMANSTIINNYNAWGDEYFRAANTPMILCFIGVFLGIMYALDSKISYRAQILGLLLTSVSIAPYIVNFFRGPLLGISSAIITIVCLCSMQKIHWNKLVRLIVMSSLIFLSGYWISVNYIPISLTKWTIVGQQLSEIIDPVRIEQTEIMIDAWLDEPIFGKGVGMPLKGYSRTEEAEGLAFEAQYPMVLYRVGLVGVIIIMMPFFWMITRTIRVWMKHNIFYESYIGKLQMAIAFATMSLLTASWTNPFFASVMSPLFIVLFLVLDDIGKIYCSIRKY